LQMMFGLRLPSSPHTPFAQCACVTASRAWLTRCPHAHCSLTHSRASSVPCTSSTASAPSARYPLLRIVWPAPRAGGSTCVPTSSPLCRGPKELLFSDLVAKLWVCRMAREWTSPLGITQCSRGGGPEGLMQAGPARTNALRSLLGALHFPSHARFVPITSCTFWAPLPHVRFRLGTG